MAVSIGEGAPPFVLPGTGGDDFDLASHRGAPVVLAFYPGDDTTVCTTQLNDYNDEMDRFDDLGAKVLGISPQDVASHEKFAQRHGFTFPLLADTDKRVGRMYGVVGPVGFYRRSVFIVDANGIIRYAHRSMAGVRYRPPDELLAALKELTSPS